jgi:putative ABC transport system ATP-binding protein
VTAIRGVGLVRTYDGSPPVRALCGADITVGRGERVAISGPSGAGKSTLLNLLGLLDEPSGGTLQVLGQETVGISRRRRDGLRARSLGFVFQDYHVLGHRTCRENVLLKLMLTGAPRARMAHRAGNALRDVGLEHRADAPARLLSGGEKQRLAVARAMVGEPGVVLADEPTGNLDAENARSVLDLFDRQSARGVAVVVITHDPATAAWADRRVELRDGRCWSVGSHG